MRKKSHSRAHSRSNQTTSRYRKRFGQVFLRDSLVVEQIVRRAQLAPGDTVLEIGSGKGALTGTLAERASTLYALEIEPPFVQALQQRFADRPHVHLIQADARRYDYAQLPQPLVVVANLPYSTATHILRHLLTYRQRLSRMVVMVQKEVAERFTAATGSKSYSGLSVFFQYYTAIEQCFDVPPQAFSPNPAVDSTVLHVEPFITLPWRSSDEHFLFQLVKCAFAHRRKTLRKNLLAIAQWQLSEADLAAIWARLSFTSTTRPQELHPAQFVALAEAVKPLLPHGAPH
jgi:16S rRNA (adenine1518-N6/adenine1519-N6)-dimethyltransferase